MQFTSGDIYHIYNQGNNRMSIFYDKENYLFFLNKMRTYLLPYADIIAWCLMPNHFHWMIYVRESNIESVFSKDTLYKRTLNDSIGYLIRSYTQAINKQESRSGSSFRTHTKAECVTCQDGITPSFYIAEFGTIINVPDLEKEYPQICFNYIHNNPVKAGLVDKSEDWEFSSYPDYFCGRKGTLVNKEIAKEFGLIR